MTPLQTEQEFPGDLFASEISPEASEGEGLNPPDNGRQVGNRQGQQHPTQGRCQLVTNWLF